MKLSIIIPTYNSANFIPRALNSILSQSFKDYEILVMDGKSTDDTIAMVKDFHDDRIFVYSEPDRGIYDAMNKGIAKASGEWVYFLGSDDWLYDNTVLYNVLIRDNISEFDVVYGEVESKHLSPRHDGEWRIEDIEYNRCHQAIFYKKTFLSKVGGYNLKYPVLADFDLNLKWFLESRFSYSHIDVTVAHFSEGGVSGRIEDKYFYKDWDRIVLLRGWRKISLEQRKHYLYDMINKNSLGRYCIKLYSFIKNRLSGEWN